MAVIDKPTLAHILSLSGDTVYYEGDIMYVVETPIGFVEIGWDGDDAIVRVGPTHPETIREDIFMGRMKGERDISALAANVAGVDDFRLVLL